MTARRGSSACTRSWAACYYSFGAGVYERGHDGVELVVETEGNRRRRVWRCGAAELEDRWEYIPQSQCWAHVEYAVKDVGGLRTLRDIARSTHYTPDSSSYRRQSDFLGGSGLPITPLPRSPVPALMADWCGVEATIFLMMDHPDEVEETLLAIDAANDEGFRIAAASEAELFHFCDNLDSSNCASYYDSHMKEYYERRLAQLHAAGKHAVVHLDGVVRGLLPKLAASGFDGVEAITPAPVGDASVEECARLVGDHGTILWGGLPGAMFCQPWNAGHIAAMTREVLERWGKSGRLVVGSADQIPPDGDISFCREVADTIESWVCLL